MIFYLYNSSNTLDKQVKMQNTISFELAANMINYCMQNGKPFDVTTIEKISNNIELFNKIKEKGFTLLKNIDLLVGAAGQLNQTYDVYIKCLNLFFRVPKNELFALIMEDSKFIHEIVIFKSSRFTSELMIEKMTKIINEAPCNTVQKLINTIVLGSHVNDQKTFECNQLLGHFINKEKENEIIDLLRPVCLFNNDQIDKAKINLLINLI